MRALFGTWSVALATTVSLLAPAPASQARSPLTLQDVVSTLVADASEFGAFLPCPTIDDRTCEHPEAVAMTVIDLDTGETASVNGNVLLPAASAVKAVWVVAAVRDLGLAAVAPLQRQIFESSDNATAGRLIDLLGEKCNAGIDRLNTIVTADFRLVDTMVPAWYDCRRALTTMPPWGEGWGRVTPRRTTSPRSGWSSPRVRCLARRKPPP